MLNGIGGSGGAPSPEQIRAMREKLQAKAFERADADGSGGISKAEFAKTRPEGVEQAKADEAFAKIDADGDGTANKDEFKAFGERNAQSLTAQFAQGAGGPPAGASPSRAAQAYGSAGDLASLLKPVGTEDKSTEDADSALIAALTIRSA
ncbi:MAG: EF-hand domain-containing protein [Tagaea sp.]|nr:EF-hand domain-containing protein [Tagaea sp.]